MYLIRFLGFTARHNAANMAVGAASWFASLFAGQGYVRGFDRSLFAIRESVLGSKTLSIRSDGIYWDDELRAKNIFGNLLDARQGEKTVALDLEIDGSIDLNRLKSFLTYLRDFLRKCDNVEIGATADGKPIVTSFRQEYLQHVLPAVFSVASPLTQLELFQMQLMLKNPSKQQLK